MVSILGVRMSPPRSGWRRSLSTRWTMAACGLLGAFAAALVTLSGFEVHRAAVAEIGAAAASDARRMAAGLERADGAREALAASGEEAGLSYASLLGESGDVLAGSTPDRPLPAASISDLPEDAAALAVAGGEAHAARAVTLPDGRRAVLRVGRSLAPAAEAARAAVARGLLVSLLFLAIALPLVAMAVERIAAPLRALTRSVERRDGSAPALEEAARRPDEIGVLARAHLSIRKVLAESADEVHRLTFDDPATRLPNRASLLARLTAALQLGRSVALVKVEMDGLARVSSGLGQRHGDMALSEAAERLRAAAAEWSRRRRDGARPVFLARVSDVGFTLLAEGADRAEATELAEVASDAFEQPLTIGEHRVSLKLTAGVALAPSDGDGADALMRSACAALAAARAAGPRAVRFAAADLNTRAYGRLRLEHELRRAIEGGELEVHYQPQIDLNRDVASGVEALVRWRHPVRGLVAPGEFMPLAEESGLIEPLGRFVLAEAARRSADWSARGIDLRVAVNVSALEFSGRNFASTTLDAIRRAGADPRRIEIEITESAATKDPEHAAREIEPLMEAGVRIAIDDFGTGYSNLATLTELPFHVLKIDRSFVRDALNSPAARAVVAAVIGLASNLGAQTVAEGVETSEQLGFVASSGCTYGQGWLFGRPVPAEALETWLAARRVAELRALAEAGRTLRAADPSAVAVQRGAVRL